VEEILLAGFSVAGAALSLDDKYGGLSLNRRRRIAMADSIKILGQERKDPETGGSVISLEVAYGVGKATILFKPGYSIALRGLRSELAALADALKSAPILK
jgi:hypothetical protein